MPRSLVAMGLQTGQGRSEVAQMNKLPPILPEGRSLLLQKSLSRQGFSQLPLGKLPQVAFHLISQ